MIKTTRPFAAMMLLAGLGLGGCFPIELSASKDGKILVPRQEGFCVLDLAGAQPTAKVVYSAKPDKPMFAAFAPDGRRFLAISQMQDDSKGPLYQLQIVAADGGNARKLLETTNPLYARWSPDGSRITLMRAADEQSPAFKKNMPELLLVDAATGRKKTLLSDTGTLHRWFPDSRHVLTIQVQSKDKDADQYSGRLVKLDVASGQAVPLASVLGGEKVFLDLSPDGGKALLVAIKAAKAGQNVPAKSDDKPRLYEVNIASGEVRAVRDGVAFAVYSPKGTKVLVGLEAAGPGAIDLAVADAALKVFRTVATDAARNAGNSDIYPGWLDDDTVHYIAVRTVFGTEARNFQLVTVRADGKSRTNLQPVIDRAAE